MQQHGRESHSSKFRPGDRVLALPLDNTGLAEYFLSTGQRAIQLPDTCWQSELVLAQPLGRVLSALRRLTMCWTKRFRFRDRAPSA